MQEENKRSAASRLLILLQAASQINGSTGVFEALAMVFGVKATERAAVFSGIAGLHDLITLAKRDVVERSELNQELYIGALNAVEAVISSLNLGTSWEQYRAQLLGANILALQFVAEQFDRLTDEIAMEADDLDALRGILEEAVAFIAASTMDRSLKVILIEKLEDARRAILRYRIDGADGIRRAGEAAVGAIVLAGPSAQAESARESVGRYLDVVSKLVDLVNKAKPLLGLLRHAAQHLLGSGDSPPQAQ